MPSTASTSSDTGHAPQEEPKERCVILIGMPAAGKSTLGVLLAKRLGFDFIDTDLLIQSSEKRTLQQIIAERGAAGFCDLEAGYILKLSCRRAVIATGGSVVYRDGAMAHLRRLGRICLLDIDLASLKERLRNLDSRGVARGPGQSIDDLFAERLPLYRRWADVVVPSSGLTHEELLQVFIEALDRDSRSNTSAISPDDHPDRHRP